MFGSSIIHILYTECAKIKKNNFGAKRLIISEALKQNYCSSIQTSNYLKSNMFSCLESVEVLISP